MCAVNANLPSSPCAIFPPDHVTIRPFTDSFQPLVGCATTSVTPAGIWTVSLTAGTLSSPSADSVMSDVLFAGTFSGLASTWAIAAGTIVSPSSVSTTSVFRMSALSDRNRDCLGVRLELALADLEGHLPVAGLREDAGRCRVVAGDDPR